MKKRKCTTPRRAAALLLTAVSVSAASAGTVDSQSFNAAGAGPIAISTAGSDGYGYVSADTPVFRGVFGASGTNGTAYNNVAYGSITELNADYTVGTTSITTVGGTYTGVTLTEGAPSNIIDSRGNASVYTFDGNTSYGSFGAFAGSEQDVFTLTFNDLGIGTFDITLYMDHSNSGRRFDMDYTLTGAAPGTTSMGATTIENLNGDTGATAFTYNITVTTTAASDDLTLTFGSLGGGSGNGWLAGYTVASAGSGSADPEITAFSVSGTTATVTISGDDTVGYWCASSTDLAGFTTAETALQTGASNPIATNPDGSFNTSGGTLTFDVNVTGDGRLFLRIQDTQPAP